MMKRTFEIIIGLSTYQLKGALKETDKDWSGFVSLTLHEAVAIRNFHRDWSNGLSRKAPSYLNLSKPCLISFEDHQAIDTAVLSTPLKLDGITYIKEKPENVELKDIEGYMVLDRETFFFQFEEFNNNGTPVHIYRSQAFGYIKIESVVDDLLKQLDEEDKDNKGFTSLHKCILGQALE